MNRLRAFIAVEMPPGVADTVRQCREALVRGGIRMRWVRPENVHLTLRFLGDIDENAVPAIRGAMARTAAVCAPFPIAVKGVGVFPSAMRARVLWMGLGGRVDLLDALVCRLSAFLAEQGILEETRAFRGHLTIGRAKGRLDPAHLRDQVAGLADVAWGPFQVERLCMFKSDLGLGGAVYTPLARIELGRAGQ